MTLLRTLISLLCIVLLARLNSTAQPWSIEANLGGYLSTPWSSFRDVSGIPGPQQITFRGDAFSQSIAASLGVDYRINTVWSIGGGFAYRPATLSYTASELAPIALPGGGLYTATLRHDIRAEISSIALAPHVRCRVLPWLSLQLGLPLQILTRARYTQVMRFTDPVGLSFVNGQLEQQTGQGPIANQRAIVPAVSVYAQAELPLNTQKDLAFIPRFGYQTSLVSVTKDGAFTLQGFDISIGVRYTLGFTSNKQAEPASPVKQDTAIAELDASPVVSYETRVERDTVVELKTGISEITTSLINTDIDTIDGTPTYRIIRETYKTQIPKPPSVLRGSIAMQFIDDDGSASNNARLTASRVVSRRSVPLVPFVMFDEDSTRIPSRYVQISNSDGKSWTERNVMSSEKHWHYELLNVIGSRMRALHTTTCQLQMHAPASDTARGNAMLRAVKTYFVNIFGVSERRIDVVPSGRGLVDGDTTPYSNCVVISDPMGGLMQPLEGTVSFVEARLPTVRVTPDAISEAGLSNWDVVIRQEQQERYRIHDSTGELHDVTVDLNDIMSADAAMKTPLAFALQLQDVEGTSMTSEPVILKLTSKALRQSERATPLKRTESLRLLRSPSQQSAQIGGYKVVYNPPWAVKGLAEPELGLYEQGAQVFIHEERRP